MSTAVILIPAYKPDDRLCGLVRDLAREGYGRILVVDDGSGPEYADLFAGCASLGAVVLRHETNRGKGRALKTGFVKALLAWPDAPGVVTADADGQHLAHDIVRVAGELSADPGVLFLGSRAFAGKVPLKSRMGNAITRFVYRAVTGRAVYDTQTGLRGIPMVSLAEAAEYPGERYEWEMEQLLRTRLPIREVPIQTVYENGNAGSHFSPLRDGMRVYKAILARAFFSK